MNHVYRLITGTICALVAMVAGFICARGRSLLTFALIAAAGSAYSAPPVSTELPTGGTVVAGQATISQAGSAMSINQATDSAAVNWNSFNVGSAATVNFNQPSVSSVMLNRVLDNNASQIFGRINANGQIFLSNPNGVYFARGASVDVGGLAATTHSISNEDFMAGRYVFNRDGATAGIINEGSLTASLDGYIALLAPEVRNQGVVVAQLGTVALAAGERYELQFGSNNTLANIRVEASTIKVLVENGNAVHAPGGLIIMSAQAANSLQGGVVNNSGRVEATGFVNNGGVIRLTASDNVNVGGTLNVSSDQGQGGEIAITAKQTILNGAQLYADGQTGGGRIRVGGGWQGGDADLSNASNNYVSSDSVISANAVESGNGGTVVLWSDEHTFFGGNISAIGGGVFGDGGLVEVSGKSWLNFQGFVDASAKNGQAGSLLLDPLNIIVQAAGADPVSPNPLTFATNPATDYTIAPSTITAITNAGTAVTLQANGDITVNNGIISNNPGGNGGALTFTAGRSILVNADIISDDGNITLNINDDGATSAVGGTANFTNIVHIDTGAGDLTINVGSKNTIGAISTGFLSGNNVTINAAKIALAGPLVLGQTVVDNQLKVYSGGTDISNPSGTVVNIGTTGVPGKTTLDSCNVGATVCGNITLSNPATNLTQVFVNATDFTLADTNAVQIGSSLGISNIRGNLNLTAYGPIGSLGPVLVTGTSTFTANSGGFGTTTPYLSLPYANHFTGTFTATVASGYATVNDTGAMTVGNVSTGTSLDITAGGTVTQTGNVSAGTSMNVSTTGGGAFTQAGNVNAGTSVTVAAAGAVTLANTTVGTGLTVTAGGAVTQVAATTITAPQQTTITATSANDITLNNSTNNFNGVRIVSGKDVTLADTNAINFGSYNNSAHANSTISGNLAVTAGGTISQNDYNWSTGYQSALAVSGASTFTVTAANSDLLIGPIPGTAGQSNNLTGTVTINTSGAGSYRDIQLRNINSGAGTIAGLGGSLRNVSLTYDNATSLTVPGMTLSGTLFAKAPNGSIGQSAALVVAGVTTIESSSGAGKAVLLDNVGNDFSSINVTTGKDVTIVDKNSVNLHTYHDGYNWRNFTVSGNLNVSALDGDITQTVLNNSIALRVTSGTATFSATKSVSATNNISLNDNRNQWSKIAIPSAGNVSIGNQSNIIFENSTIAGTLTLTANGGYQLSQTTGSTITTGGTTTFNNFNGIVLGSATETNNVFGNLLMNSENVTIRENDAITQAGATWRGSAFYFTTSNDQAITLDQANYFGNVNITQINNGAASAGDVFVRETGNHIYQAQPWVTHGRTTLNASGNQVVLQNQNNTFGPLQVLGGGTTYISAKDWTGNDAITDVGSTGAWSSGYTDLRAYNSGSTATTGTINLSNAANVLGDLTLYGGTVSITDNSAITDYGSANGFSSQAWRTTGVTTLNSGANAITLDNNLNVIGPIAIVGTSGGTHPSSVTIAENDNIDQASAWTLGTAPVTLNAFNRAINLTQTANVLGNITITTKSNTANNQDLNMVPTSVNITEDDAITQGAVWDFKPSSGTTTPVTLVTTNGQAISLGARDNLLGNLIVTQNGTGTGAVAIREIDTAGITQPGAGAWTTRGTTTLDTNAAVNLPVAGNVLGPITVNGAYTPTVVTITENDDITQASAWGVGTAPVTLNAGSNQILLTNASNVLGNITLAGTPSLASIRENDPITQTTAWLLGSSPVTLATSNDQAITLNQNNILGGLAITQYNSGATSFGDVLITEVDPSGITQSGAWITHGITTLNIVAAPITLTQTGNVLANIAINGTPTAVSVTENDAITQNSAWSLGTAPVTLVTTNAQAINLGDFNNLLGHLTVIQNGSGSGAVSIKESDVTNGITQTATPWLTLGATKIDANGYGITLAVKDNVFGPLQLVGGTSVGTSVTLYAKQTAIHDAITDSGAAGAWTTGTTTLHAYNIAGDTVGGGNIALTNTNNSLGDLNLKGATVGITENGAITDGAAGWQTTGTTSINPGSNGIILDNLANVLGNIAVNATTTAVTITEDDDITQASAWILPTAPVTLNAQSRDILLTQAANQLGDLSLTAQNVTVVENHGITDSTAWAVPGLTTLTAGTNAIVLDANPRSNFGTVRIVSAANADIADVNGIILDSANVTGTFTVTAGGAITQTANAITANAFVMNGSGASAVLNTPTNNVASLAVAFTAGGGLQYTDADNVSLTSITVGANPVVLTSVAGTLTGLNSISSSASALTINTGAGITVPALNIAGPQSYTAGGTGITLDGNLGSTATGAINFNSPVTLNRDLTVSSTNSPITFGSTVAGGTNSLGINAGIDAITFNGAVSNLGNTLTSNAALTVTATAGATIFNSTLSANNGLLVSGPSTFKDTVTLLNGGIGSTFTGEVTLGKAGGMNLSGYKYMDFNSGISLASGPATIVTNNFPLRFNGGTVHGPFALELNAGTGGNATISGLNLMGSDLTGLTVSAYTPTIPSGGISIAGPQTYTADTGTSITLNGNVTSTAAGAITFNSPVSVLGTATVTSTNSAISFMDIVDGTRDLTINSGTAPKTFANKVGGTNSLGDGVGAALILQGSGVTSFSDTVAARSGITAAGPVTFAKDVALTNGDTGSTFTGMVTSGGASGNTLGSYDGMAFNGGLTLVGGPVNIVTNGGTLAFGAAVTGPQNLTLNTFAGGAGTVTGLDWIGFTSDLTKPSVTGQTLSLPNSGLAVAGTMDFTAVGGITLNGAVGNSAAPATGQIDFTGPVTLATGPVTVTTNDAAVNFTGSVNGGQPLTVNAGTAATTFTGAVGDTVALTSVTTDAGGTTAINGGQVKTTGAQAYNDAVTLGAATTLTSTAAGDITFGSTLNNGQTEPTHDN